MGIIGRAVCIVKELSNLMRCCILPVIHREETEKDAPERMRTEKVSRLW